MKTKNQTQSLNSVSKKKAVIKRDQSPIEIEQLGFRGKEISLRG